MADRVAVQLRLGQRFSEHQRFGARSVAQRMMPAFDPPESSPPRLHFANEPA